MTTPDTNINADTETVRTAGNEIGPLIEALNTWKADMGKVQATIAADGTVDSVIMPAAQATIDKASQTLTTVGQGIDVVLSNLTTVSESLVAEAGGLEDIDETGAKDTQSIPT